MDMHQGVRERHFNTYQTLIKKNMNGYVNGSDLLLLVGAACIGHCTSHTTTFNSETKDRAVKPAASVEIASAALFKDKSVTGLSIQIKANGLAYYGESESGFKQLYALWKAGQPVDASCFERGQDASPYLAGKFIISSLEREDPANDDSTYNITLDNAGAPTTLDETKLDLNAGSGGNAGGGESEKN